MNYTGDYNINFDQHSTYPLKIVIDLGNKKYSRYINGKWYSDYKHYKCEIKLGVENDNTDCSN